MNDPFYQLHWQQLQDPLLAAQHVELWVCQLRTQVPTIAGNKWLKLKYHIQQIQQHNKTGIVSFGGAFSNHLVALAAAGAHYHFPTVGIVRAHRADPANPTLQHCQALGMQLHWISPALYRQHCTLSRALLQPHPHELEDQQMFWQQRYPDYLLVPEGGSSSLALRGVAELPIQQTPSGPATLLACASASGGTLAGFISAQPTCDLLGISVVKDAQLAAKIQALVHDIAPHTNWQLWQESCGKAYGKFSPATLDFCLKMALEQGIPTEPIYTGKALHSLYQWALQGRFAIGSRIVFFHTGGLQGLAGLVYRGAITPTQADQLLASQAFPAA